MFVMARSISSGVTVMCAWSACCSSRRSSIIRSSSSLYISCSWTLMTLASRVCWRICTRPAIARRKRSVHRTGRSPMTATTRSTIVAWAGGAATTTAAAESASAGSVLRRLAQATLLPLAVLEALAGAGLPVLLAFLLARVAREKARSLDRSTLLGVERDEGARDAVAHGLGLRRLAAARARGPHVELILGFDELEGLPQDHPRRLALEVLVDREVVDDDGAVSGFQPDARDGGLALAGGVCAGVDGGHSLVRVLSGLGRRCGLERRQQQGERLLGRVRMIRRRVELQLR